MKAQEQTVISEAILTKDEQITPIYISYNYDQFGFIDGNRKINPCNYAKLEKSMLEKQLIIPICVNKDKKIIDGQHRFTVEKNNSLPVYYYIVEDYDIEAVKRANMVSRNWTKKDFLDLQIEYGKDSYLVFSYLVETYKINIQDLLKVFGIAQGKTLAMVSKSFEAGELSDDGCEEVEAFLKALDDFKHFRYYTTKPFVTAFIKLYFNDKYNHAKMKERLRTRKGALVKKSSCDEYLVHLTRDIYSFGAVRKPLYYDASTKKFYS